MANDIQVTEFIMDFVGRSREARKQYVPIWAEVLNNYLVRPDYANTDNDTGAPYYNDGGFSRSPTSYLKDPETRQVIDTLLSKITGALFPDETYIAAKPRGREDGTAAATTTALLDYVFGLDDHHRAIQVWLLDMLLFGTGIVQVGWKLDERPRTFRDIVGVDEFGNEIREEVRIPNFPVYDDPRFMNIDIMDFFPDFGVDNLRDMLGCAKRVELTGFDAMRNPGFDKQAVKSALLGAGVLEGAAVRDDKNWRPERARLATRHPGFQPLEAHEYYGLVPKSVKTYKSGEQWRVITIANGQTLRDSPWFYDDYRLPFFDATISPIGGKFYGQSPGEAARFQQDFLDFLLTKMAEAVARTVSPPIAYDVGAVEDPQAMRAWRFDAPIPVEGNPNAAIATTAYNPNMNNGLAFFNTVRESLRGNSGALGVVQGAGMKNSRSSATEAERTFQMALDRPEMFATYIEKQCLPPMGRFTLKICQQNLETTEELTDRIGEMPEPAILADIQGDFDVRFVGSRNNINAQTKIQFMDRLFQLAQIPQLANLIDWKEIGIQILEGMGFDKIVESMSVPDTVKQNLLMTQLSNPGAMNDNGNGQSGQGGAPALPAAQEAGTTTAQG